MGVEWNLRRLEWQERAPVPAPMFDPHPYEPEEISVMLVGDMEGPLMDLLAESDERTGLIPPDAVKRCHERVRSIRRDQFAPFETVLDESCHTVLPEDEQCFYEGVADMAEAFQRFVSAATEAGHGLRFWVSGMPIPEP